MKRYIFILMFQVMASLFAWKIKNRAKYCQQINNLVGFIIFCRPYVKEQYYTAVFVQYVQRGIFIGSRWGKVVDVILNSCAPVYFKCYIGSSHPTWIASSYFLRWKKRWAYSLHDMRKCHVKTGIFRVWGPILRVTKTNIQGSVLNS